jgi:co-chaperonin GroES (HSP10)
MKVQLKEENKMSTDNLRENNYEIYEADKLNASQWAVINGTEALRAIGHRILVLEDQFTSGYECKACGGTGHTEEKCKYCNGTTFYKSNPDGGACPDCEVGTSDGRKSLGYKICPTCKGKTGILVIPDEAKRRPVTGKILSKGKDVTEFEVGAHVLYTNYTGTDFELKGGVKLRIMMDHDVMSEYKRLQPTVSVGTGRIEKDLQDHGIAS